MKRTLKTTMLFLATLILIFTFNVSSSYANVQGDVSETNKYLLEQEKQEKVFQEIIKNVPNGTYSGTDITTNSVNASSYSPEAGDILYTPSTQCKDDNRDICKGLTGHVGIVNPSTGTVTHIQAPGYLPKSISLNSWFNTYPKTTVVRHNDATKASKAANWAFNYYIWGNGADKTYKVTVDSDLTKTLSLDTTYCSLILWQAYYFGAGQKLSLNIPVMPILFVNYASYHDMTVHMKIGY